MAYNWEKGLVGGAMGTLSGYGAMLEKRSKSELEDKKQEALLQREKQMAKYQQTLSRENKVEQRGYEEQQAKDNAYSGFMEGDRKISMLEKQGMTPEQSSSLTSGSDYKIDQATKVSEAQMSVAQKQRAQIQGEKDAANLAEVDKTMDYMTKQMGWDEGQASVAREFMMAQGITKPQDLQKALVAKQGAMTQGAIETATKNAEKRATEAVLELGLDGQDRVKELDRLNKIYYTEEIMRAESGVKPGTKASLTVPQRTAAERMKRQIDSGAVTLEEVKVNRPDLYEIITGQPAVEEGPQEAPITSPSMMVQHGPQQAPAQAPGPQQGPTTGPPVLPRDTSILDRAKNIPRADKAQRKAKRDAQMRKSMLRSSPY